MANMKKDKQTNSNQQNITPQTKNRVTRTPLKTRGFNILIGVFVGMDNVK